MCHLAVVLVVYRVYIFIGTRDAAHSVTLTMYWTFEFPALAPFDTTPDPHDTLPLNCDLDFIKDSTFRNKLTTTEAHTMAQALFPEPPCLKTWWRQADASTR